MDTATDTRGTEMGTLTLEQRELIAAALFDYAAKYQSVYHDGDYDDGTGRDMSINSAATELAEAFTSEPSDPNRGEAFAYVGPAPAVPNIRDMVRDVVAELRLGETFDTYRSVRDGVEVADITAREQVALSIVDALVEAAAWDEESVA